MTEEETEAQGKKQTGGPAALLWEGSVDTGVAVGVRGFWTVLQEVPGCPQGEQDHAGAAGPRWGPAGGYSRAVH